MEIPHSRDELRERWKAGERFPFYFFYGHRPPVSGVDSSCLSQWFDRSFTIDGVDYATAEHWMMAEKARLFDDDTMLKEILASPSPRDAKACGRKVSGFQPGIWNQHKFEIVKKGNFAKFTQHVDLKDFLLSTAEQNLEIQLRAVAESKDRYQIDVEQERTREVKERLAIYRVESERGDSGAGESKSLPISSKTILVEAAGRDTIWGIGFSQHNPKAQDPLTWRGLNLLGFALTEVREQIIRECGNQ